MPQMKIYKTWSVWKEHLQLVSACLLDSCKKRIIATDI
jgi:hypothetical protein